MTLAENIVRMATSLGLQITTAESCTGGMVAVAITDVPGSSAVFERGFVTYSNSAKQDMVDVRASTLDAHGAVSEEVAREMALGARATAHADIAVAISGIAGPGGSDFKPEGRVCYAICTAHECRSMTLEHGALGRDNVRSAARDAALKLVFEALSNQGD